MKMTLHRLRLPLAHEFRISRGAVTNQPTLIVELEHEGVRGLGEVTENSFYGHTFASMTASLEKAESLLNEYVDHSPLEVWSRFYELLDGDTFALAALDMAAHDLHGKRNRLPTWQAWGLDWHEDVPPSSYTIGIDTIETMVAKLHEQPGWSIYKIKLGTSQDIEIVTELRRHTEAVFRVDANCDWTADQTIAMAPRLAQLGVEFIEQPLPITASDADKRRVYEASVLPIVADEDCQRAGDVDDCAGFFHGINVKLCKCGGLTPALRMLHRARELELKTMVGCMVESSIGISGAAQLLPLLDFADLDGAVLLADDPARGVIVDHGVIKPSERFGCGAELVAERVETFRIPNE